MRKLSPVLSVGTLRLLYSSLVLSHLTYGVEIWGGSARTERNSLISVQNKCVKFLIGGGNDVLSDVYKCNNLLPFVDIHRFYTLLRFKRYLLNDHFFLVDKLSQMQHNHDHLTRFSTAGNFTVHPINLSIYFNSFFHQGVKMYNDLPSNIKEVNNLQSYRKLLKTHLASNV